MRVRAYFDGFNFYHGSLAVAELHEEEHGTPLHWKWLDVSRLCRNLASLYWGEVEVVRTVYCTAKVKPGHPGDPKPGRQRDYLQALQAHGVEVVYGTFKRRREKGSDVNLATCLLVDYFTQRDSYDASLIVSNDWDLYRPVETLRANGWPVGIVSPHGERKKIVLADNRRRPQSFAHLMTAADLMGAPLNDPIVGLVEGVEVTTYCPDGWRQRETPPQ